MYEYLHPVSPDDLVSQQTQKVDEHVQIDRRVTPLGGRRTGERLSRPVMFAPVYLDHKRPRRSIRWCWRRMLPLPA